MSPQIFNALTKAVCRIMAHNGHHDVLVYLDDFLIISDSQEQCNIILTALLKLLRFLGFSINYDKLVSPTKRITFLGVILDSEKMCLELPEDKLTEFKDILIETLNYKKVNKQKLQSIAGKLNWATQCIYGGKFHLRRIIDRINQLRRPWHRIRVTADMRADLKWWLCFMDTFNGSVKILDKRPTTPVFIDACPVASGCFYEGQFVYTPWDTWSGTDHLHINHKEALSLEPAVAQWASQWSNKKVIVHCDNQAAVSMLNKCSSRDPTVMASLRRIFWWSAKYNFRICAIYYPGKDNFIADAVSRLHEPYFKDILYPFIKVTSHNFVCTS